MVRTEFSTGLKSKLLDGINKLNASVTSTLGPSGRNVLISAEDETIRITKDGVTVAKAFDKLEDPIENIGAQLVKQVSIKSGDKAGDGTTTSTLLATEILNEGVKVISQGANAIEVKRGIDKATKKVISRLQEISQDIKKGEEIKQVATISGNNDPEIGIIISSALESVDDDGIVVIEESKSGDTILEKVEGMMVDRGYKSPFFVTDQASAEAVLEKPFIFIYNGVINQMKEILEVVQYAASKNNSLLIVADDVEHEALAFLVMNKARGTVKVCAIKSPDFGDRRTAILEDMAILTGAKMLSQQKGDNLLKLKATDVPGILGNARLVTSTSKDTTIVDGKGSPEAILERLKEIKSLTEKAKSDYEKQNYQTRLGKLAGGVAIIHVGGMSEVELKEKKDRVDDALHASKAALEQGIVPGGGMAFINCLSVLNEKDYDNQDQILGMQIIKKAIKAPFTKILKNAGIEDPHEILANIRTKDSIWNGYNVKTGEYGDLKDMGVIDPTKVTKTALENAASIAGTVLTTESVVYHLPEENKGQQEVPGFQM